MRGGDRTLQRAVHARRAWLASEVQSLSRCQRVSRDVLVEQPHLIHAQARGHRYVPARLARAARMASERAVAVGKRSQKSLDGEAAAVVG